MTNLSSLPTPSAVIDHAKLQHNIARLAAHLSVLGVGLRPHHKTLKSIEPLRMALKGQPGGVTVSTLREAEQCVEHDIMDITYAVGISADKLDRVATLNRKGARISVLLDSLEQARAVAGFTNDTNRPIEALIEIDSDGHRGGLQPSDPLLTEIGSILNAAPTAVLRGVLTHAGESYSCFTAESLEAMAHQERDAAVEASRSLTAAGLPCPVISVGSTPTVLSAQDLRGVTEVRAGVYMTFDLVMAGIGVCTVDEIALTVLATVLGHQPSKGWVITDAGWMAMSRDRGTAAQPVDHGYGLVCDIDGNVISDVLMSSTNQEHGIITARSEEPLDVTRFPIGTRFRILPNHACATGAMHDHYSVVDPSGDVVELWDRVRGW